MPKPSVANSTKNFLRPASPNKESDNITCEKADVSYLPVKAIVFKKNVRYELASSEE